VILMLNKAVYTINIMLMLFWSYSLIDLWRQMSHIDSRSIAERGINWVDVQKTAHPWEPDVRNLFDSKPAEAKKVTAADAASNPEDALNEKGLADFSLRVRGIFISRQQRFAVIDKVSKKTSKNESVKVILGDVVVGFAVKSILPSVVTLVNPETAEIVILKIFKPPQANPSSPLG
jgi:hypothetical protein